MLVSKHHLKGHTSKLSLKTYTKIINIKIHATYDFQFNSFKSHMVADLGELHINEKRLFHGTAKDVALSICKEGFDWRLCGKNGTAFGQGT